MLLVHQNTGKENRYGKNFFAVLLLSSTSGRFDRANKKKSVIYTLNFEHLKVFEKCWKLKNIAVK